jgi:hypothetical protein
VEVKKMGYIVRQFTHMDAEITYGHARMRCESNNQSQSSDYMLRLTLKFINKNTA